ncbi:uncharacterized protein LOC126747546 [Anthonomus grandis grandis]|uniref:uncharacterized protein LOC126747546 n=1 Tax=Anthonomus grandis grandis TaxID=2921223 RepID=UPI002165CFE5|nr:uncharacterized protein LOC126747546 [Anthonomus grandis grandis]
MGKHKRRHRSSSSESDSDSKHKKLHKRLAKLESLLKKRSRSRSRSRFPAERTKRRGRSTSVGRSRSPTVARSRLSTPSRSVRQKQADNSPVISDFNNSSSVAQDPRGLASTLDYDESIAHSPSGVASPTDELLIHNDYDLPEEVLNILGDDPSIKDSEQVKVHPALASRWSNILIKGLSEADTTGILQKYKIPVNCPLLVPPTLNPESYAIIPQNIRNKDNAYVQFQTKLGMGLAILGKNIDGILNEADNMPPLCKEVLLPGLSDTGRLLTSLFYDLTMARRSFIYPYMNKDTKELLEKCPPSDLLFGPDICEKIKAAKTLQTASKDMNLFPQHLGLKLLGSQVVLGKKR